MSIVSASPDFFATGDSRPPRSSRFEYSDTKRNRSIKNCPRTAAFYPGWILCSCCRDPPAVGLYGVLDYSVLHLSRGIGIRIALGLRNRHIIQEVTSAIFAVVAFGLTFGYSARVSLVRYIHSILYRVSAADPVIFLIRFSSSLRRRSAWRQLLFFARNVSIQSKCLEQIELQESPPELQNLPDPTNSELDLPALYSADTLAIQSITS